MEEYHRVKKPRHPNCSSPEALAKTHAWAKTLYNPGNFKNVPKRLMTQYGKKGGKASQAAKPPGYHAYMRSFIDPENVLAAIRKRDLRPWMEAGWAKTRKRSSRLKKKYIQAAIRASKKRLANMTQEELRERSRRMNQKLADKICGGDITKVMATIQQMALERKRNMTPDERAAFLAKTIGALKEANRKRLANRKPPKLTERQKKFQAMPESERNAMALRLRQAYADKYFDGDLAASQAHRLHLMHEALRRKYEERRRANSISEHPTQ